MIFVPYELSWDEFLSEWVPQLKADGIKVGVNWSGKGAVGYDMEPDDVVANVSYYIEKLAVERSADFPSTKEKPMPNQGTDSWFIELPADQKPVLAKLRKLILAAGPDVVEEIKWGRPCYGTAQGLFCYLHSTKNYATLGFHKGTGLKDPKKLLEGTGKEMRHIKIKTTKDLDEPAVKALLKQAVTLGT